MSVFATISTGGVTATVEGSLDEVEEILSYTFPKTVDQIHRHAEDRQIEVFQIVLDRIEDKLVDLDEAQAEADALSDIELEAQLDQAVDLVKDVEPNWGYEGHYDYDDELPYPGWPY